MTKHKVHEAKNALNFIAQLYSERGQGREKGGWKEGVSDGDGKNEKRSKVRGKSLQQHR